MGLPKDWTDPLYTHQDLKLERYDDASASLEMGVGPELWDFIESLPRMQAAQPIATGGRGNASTASLITLAKRAAYGGWKGRRAILRVSRGQWGPTPVTIDPYAQRWCVKVT